MLKGALKYECTF